MNTIFKELKMREYEKRNIVDKKVNLFLNEELFIKIKNQSKNENKTLKIVLNEIIALGYKLYKRRKERK